MGARYIYYLDGLTGVIKGGAECSRYDLRRDIDFKDKSTAVVVERPKISNDDIVVINEGKESVFVGMVESISAGKSPYTLNILQKENLFDRTVFAEDENIIRDAGMEDFIAWNITNRFIGGGDALFDKPFLHVSAETHTPINTTVASTVNAESGVYNFKTFLGNVLQYYGIGLVFTVLNGWVDVAVRKDPVAALLIDTRYTDIEGLEETYSVKVLAKLIVRWKNTSTEAVTDRTFYLQADRTITENASSTTRVSGTVESVYIEAESEADMLQEVRNRFTSNTYDHSMTMNIPKGSRLYAPEDLYVGRKVRIRSGKTGLITETMITRKEESSGSEIQKITMGRLPVTLVDKIRRL